jgi:hypothetical protein
MLPIISKSIVPKQRSKRKNNVDNSTYITFYKQKRIFYTFRWATIGSMSHLVPRFQAFKIRNNAAVLVAEISKEQTKNGFKSILDNSKELNTRETFVEEPITQTIKAKFEDANIQIPAIVAAYRTPSMKTRDAKVLDMISSILDGKLEIIQK